MKVRSLNYTLIAILSGVYVLSGCTPRAGSGNITTTHAQNSNKANKGLFDDFKILKSGTTKRDIEKHFGVKLSNTDKTPDTNAIEEVININLDNSMQSPMILGFDTQDRLIYVRDITDRNNITWLDQSKRVRVGPPKSVKIALDNPDIQKWCEIYEQHGWKRSLHEDSEGPYVQYEEP